MNLLLLHPDDDLQRSWAGAQWDLIVDLGKAPKSFYEDWSRTLGCPIFSIFDLAVEVEDLLAWRDPLRLGLGQVVDRFGIDWWDVVGLLLQPEMQDMRLTERLAKKVGTARTFTVTRPSLLADALRVQLGCSMEVMRPGPLRAWPGAWAAIGRPQPT